MNERVELMSKAFITWTLSDLQGVKIDILNPYDSEYQQKLPTSCIATLRVNHFGIQIPVFMAMIHEIGNDGRPGVGIMMMAHALKNIAENKYNGKLPEGYIVTPEDYASVFPFGFMDVHETKWLQMLEELWDKQKDAHGKNRVDGLEYWQEFMPPAVEGNDHGNL